MEDVADRGKTVPEGECPGVVGGGAAGNALRQRSAHALPGRWTGSEGRRLTRFSTPIDKTSGAVPAASSPAATRQPGGTGDRTPPPEPPRLPGRPDRRKRSTAEATPRRW